MQRVQAVRDDPKRLRVHDKIKRQPLEAQHADQLEHVRDTPRVLGHERGLDRNERDCAKSCR